MLLTVRLICLGPSCQPAGNVDRPTWLMASFQNASDSKNAVISFVAAIATYAYAL